MDVYELADKHRAAVLAGDNAAKKRLIEAYKTVDADLQARCAALLDLIEQKQAAGEEINRAWLQREIRYNALLEQVAQRVKSLVQLTADETMQGVQANLTAGTQDAIALISAASGKATVAGAFDRLNAKASENIVAYLAPDAPLGKLLARIGDEMPREAVQRAKDALIVGVTTGQNPRVVARTFQAATGASLTRSLTISRTEQLRAYRQASLQTYADSDLITRYQWLSAKSARTCVACLAMDAKVFEKDDPFLAHVRCRCTVVPIVDEPRERQTGEQWLKAQDETTQNEIMGEAAATAWRRGEVQLGDFVGVRKNKEWGDSVFHDSLKGARERAEKRYKTQSRDADNPQGGTDDPAARTTRRGRAVTQPEGKPITEFLSVSDEPYAQPLRNVMNTIARVHGVGDLNLPRIPLDFGTLDRGVSGQYNRAANPADPPQSIVIRRQVKRAAMTTAHEVGHYLDDWAFGTGGGYASSSQSAVLKGWHDAVQSSQAVADLRRIQAEGDVRVFSYTAYLLRDEEIWARSYAQYIATRSGDAGALNDLGLLRDRNAVTTYVPSQWDDDDFAPIASAMDDMFKGLGWIK